jgi:uncharacterized paraquat-inducible protein A
MTDIKTIVKAWITASNPSTQDITKAEERLSTCYECPELKKLASIEYCSKCLCPINKKVFSEQPTCPLGKWKQ